MPSMKKKILLMGRSGCGKTSMRALIFSSANYPNPASTKRLGTTLGSETSHVRFLKNLQIALYDMGGQQTYMDSYLDEKKDQVFKDVGTFVYVFDLGNADQDDDDEGWEGDFRYWRDCLRLLHQHSPDANVVCLLHKMDLVDASRRRDVYAQRVRELRSKARDLGEPDLTCYGTSIWDETLYRAWSRIIHELIPNIAMLESNLTQFAQITSATEAVIFERTTFLVIARSGAPTAGTFEAGPAAAAAIVPDTAGSTAKRGAAARVVSGSSTTTTSSTAGAGKGSSASATASEDAKLMEGYPPTEMERQSLLDRGEMHPDRFEKISGLVKNLRGSCNKLQGAFQSFEVRGATFSAYLDVFTSNTYIMVIVADPRIELSAIRMNVQLGRDRFEKLG